MIALSVCLEPRRPEDRPINLCVSTKFSFMQVQAKIVPELAVGKD